jgi:hypothetical protein
VSSHVMVLYVRRNAPARPGLCTIETRSGYDRPRARTKVEDEEKGHASCVKIWSEFADESGRACQSTRALRSRACSTHNIGSVRAVMMSKARKPATYEPAEPSARPTSSTSVRNSRCVSLDCDHRTARKTQNRIAQTNATKVMMAGGWWLAKVARNTRAKARTERDCARLDEDT